MIQNVQAVLLGTNKILLPYVMYNVTVYVEIVELIPQFVLFVERVEKTLLLVHV